MEILVDGVHFSFTDLYAAVSTPNMFGSASIVIGFTGEHIIKLTSTTKNPSSGGYGVSCTRLRLK